MNESSVMNGTSVSSKISTKSDLMRAVLDQGLKEVGNERLVRSIHITRFAQSIGHTFINNEKELSDAAIATIPVYLGMTQRENAVTSEASETSTASDLVRAMLAQELKERGRGELAQRADNPGFSLSACHRFMKNKKGLSDSAVTAIPVYSGITYRENVVMSEVSETSAASDFMRAMLAQELKDRGLGELAQLADNIRFSLFAFYDFMNNKKGLSDSAIREIAAHFGMAYRENAVMHETSEPSTASDFMRAVLAQELKERGRGGLTQLADSIKYSRSALHDFMNNKKGLSDSVRAAIAAQLGMTYEEMLIRGRSILEGVPVAEICFGLARFSKELNGIGPGPPKLGRIPIINWEDAMEFKEKRWDEYKHGDGAKFVTTLTAFKGNAFAVIVQDDLMSPVFLIGDYIIVDPDLLPVNGDYVIAEVGGALILRKYVVAGTAIYMAPEDTRYPVESMDGLTFKIVGVVVEKTKVFVQQERQGQQA